MLGCGTDQNPRSSKRMVLPVHDKCALHSKCCKQCCLSVYLSDMGIFFFTARTNPPLCTVDHHIYTGRSQEKVFREDDSPDSTPQKVLILKFSFFSTEVYPLYRRGLFLSLRFCRPDLENRLCTKLEENLLNAPFPVMRKRFFSALYNQKLTRQLYQPRIHELVRTQHHQTEYFPANEAAMRHIP